MIIGVTMRATAAGVTVIETVMATGTMATVAGTMAITGRGIVEISLGMAVLLAMADTTLHITRDTRTERW
jgi:hypothetical protein